MSDRQLTVDPTHGVTEQLLLGALLDAGAPAPAISRSVATLGGGDVRMSWARVERDGQAAMVVDVRAPDATPAVGSWRRVHGLLAHVAADDAVRDLALAAMTRHVEGLAHVEGVPADELVLPEYGMLDDLAISVAVATALVALGVTRTVVAGDVPVGSGSLVPVVGNVQELPDPVVCHLLGDLPTVPGPTADALVTSRLGAAWLATLGATVGVAPEVPDGVVGRGASHRGVGHDGTLRVMLHAPDEDRIP